MFLSIIIIIISIIVAALAIERIMFRFLFSGPKMKAVGLLTVITFLILEVALVLKLMKLIEMKY